MNKRVVVPAVVGLVAVLLGGYFLRLTLQDPPVKAAEQPDAVTRVALTTTHVVSRPGGFSVEVPQGLTATQHGADVRLISEDRTLSIAIGPAPAESLAKASSRFVRVLQGGYSQVRVLGTKTQEVNGLPALSTYGQAVNAKNIKVRFVNVAIATARQNYTIGTFTAFGSDPAFALPRVNAVANGFRVLADN